MGRNQRSGVEGEIDSLLQRVKRQTTEEHVPPNQASAALGRRLATALFALDEGASESSGDEILNVIIAPTVNPSVPRAYFETLACNNEMDPMLMECLPRWIVLCENSGNCLAALSAATDAYATAFMRQEDSSMHTQQLIDTFYRLSSGRLLLVRSFTRPLHKDLSYVRRMLSPIMASCVLSRAVPLGDKYLCLETIWRECWFVLQSASSDSHDVVVDFLSWMQRALYLFVIGQVGQPVEQRVASMELARGWLVRLVDAMACLAQNKPKKSESVLDRIHVLTSELVRDVVPHVQTMDGSFPMDSVFQQLVAVTRAQPAMNPSSDPLLLFRLSIMTLSTPSHREISAFLEFSSLQHVMPSNVAAAMMQSLAYMYGSDEAFNAAAFRLRQNMSVATETNFHGRVTSILHLFLKHSSESNAMLQTMIRSLRFVSLGMSVQQQNAALILGISLLWNNDTVQARERAQECLRHLLNQSPSLSITLLPVVLEFVRQAAQSGDGHNVLHWLGFLCDAVTHDPHCAQEVWSIVAVKELGNTTVQSAAIRLYPRLCRRNKKMYRRIVDALVVASVSSEDAMRLAVAATIAELAKEDRIRDVSDVIGLIQTFLTDENDSVVHYALLSLHYLLEAQELDFDIVIKVLNKRLCTVTNVDEILKLSELRLEALVLLLGDGEISDDESSQEGDDGRAYDGGSSVSPQVTAAVRILVELAESDTLSSESNHYTRQASVRIRNNLYTSLSKYSLHALGVDDVAIREVAARESSDQEKSTLSQNGSRYRSLTQILLQGLRDSSVPQSDEDPTVESEPAVKLARKLIEYEEEILGPSLWKKGRGKLSEESKSRTKISRERKQTINVLPSTSTVFQFYKEDPSTITAISSLLCLELKNSDEQNSTVGEMMAQLSDIVGDISNDLSDFVYLALELQGWLRCMDQVWSVVSELDIPQQAQAIQTVLGTIAEWEDSLETMDRAYLSLTCFAVHIPDSHGRFVDSIESKLLQAYRGHLFENTDIPHICFGLLGVCGALCLSRQRTDDAVNLLTQAMDRPNSQGIFGAAYGLGLIAQVLPQSQEMVVGSSLEDREFAGTIGRIAGRLVAELGSTLESTSKELISFEACLRSGRASPDLVQALSKINDSSFRVRDNMREKVKSLGLTLAICLPSLRSLSNDLLLASYHLIEGIPWGYGKGIALPSLILTCSSVGMLSSQKVDSSFEKYVSDLDLAIERNDEDVVGDVLFATCSLSHSATNGPHSVYSNLDRVLRNRDGAGMSSGSHSLLSVIAGACFVGTVPCLGGPPLFYSEAQLRPTSSKDETANTVKLISDLSISTTASIGREHSVIALGLLASMRHQRANNCVSTVARRIQSTVKAAHQIEGENKIEFSRVPEAHEGTLVAGVLRLARKDVELESQKESESFILPQLLYCLTTISVPGPFASSFLEHILADSRMSKDEIKIACVRLLISQLVRRRRAAFDGSEFVKMYVKMAMLSPSSFLSLLGDGNGREIFLASFPKALPKIPSESVGPALEKVFSLSCEDGEFDSQIAFLGSLRELLSNVSSTNEKGKILLSPKTISTVRRFVLFEGFAGLRDSFVIMDEDTTSRQSESACRLFDAFANCVSSVPVEMLKESQFLSYEKLVLDEACLRVMSVMKLAQCGYFSNSNQRSREITRAVAWFVRMLVSNDNLSQHKQALRRVVFVVATASKEESASSIKDLILMILESSLLVKGSNRKLCLEFLAVLLASWVPPGAPSSAEFSLSSLFFGSPTDSEPLSLSATIQESLTEMIVDDLCWNISAYCNYEDNSGTIINRVLRILNAWKKDDSVADEVDSLRKSLLCCRPSDGIERAYANIASEALM